MRWRIPLAAVLALFVAVSCDQQPVEPPTDQVAEAPALNFMNGPESPGNSGVFRDQFDDCWWCETGDPSPGGLYAIHAQADDIFYCGGSSGWATWDMQEVTNKSGTLYNQQARDVPVFLYDMEELNATCDAGFPEPCCTYIAEEWLYKGTHDMTALDKWQENSTYTEFKAHGFVYDHDLIRYRYREHQVHDLLTDTWTHETIDVH